VCLLLSLKRAEYGDEVKGLMNYFDICRAVDTKEFAEAVKGLTWSTNLLYADNEGNIAYWYTGKQPIRVADHDGRSPVPGTGEYEWLGFLPFEDMPHIVNPKRGYLVTRNNKPSKRWPFSSGRGSADMGAEGRVVDHLLKESEKITLKDLVDMFLEASRRSYVAEPLKPHILKAYEERRSIRDPLAYDPRVGEAVEALARWDDCEFEREADQYNFQAVILDEWVGRMMQRLFADRLGPFAPRESAGWPPWPRLSNPTILVQVLEGAEKSMDYLDGREKNVVTLECLKETLSELENRYGTRDISRWTVKVTPLELRQVGDDLWIS